MYVMQKITHEIIIIDMHNVIFTVAELPRRTLHFNTPSYAVGHRGLAGLHVWMSFYIFFTELIMILYLLQHALA